MAGAVVFVPRKGSNNWGFQTVSDPGLNHRRDFHSLGRGLGGGSAGGENNSVNSVGQNSDPESANLSGGNNFSTNNIKFFVF